MKISHVYMSQNFDGKWRVTVTVNVEGFSRGYEFSKDIKKFWKREHFDGVIREAKAQCREDVVRAQNLLKLVFK
jgi:hypothetical protein